MLLNHTTNHLTIRPHKTSCLTKSPWAKEENFEDKYCHMWKEKKKFPTNLNCMEHHFQMLFAVGIKELMLWPMTVVSIFFSTRDRITGLIGVTVDLPTRELCLLLAQSLLPFSYHTGISHHLTFKINSPFIWVDCPHWTSTEKNVKCRLASQN